MGQNGINIGGGLGFSSMKEAFKQALQEAGGGGGGLTFPDAIVTGIGSYVIPVGFNAIVNVTCQDGAIMTVNGNNAVGSRALIINRINSYGNNLTNLTATMANNHYGELQLSDSNSTTNFKADNANLRKIPNGTSGMLSNNIKLGPSGTANIQSSSSQCAISGYSKSAESVFSQAKLSTPEGTVINGGSYRIIELYAI